MHHSDDEARRSAFVTCYVDESSTDDKVLPHGVLGGVVMNKNGFLMFEEAWFDLLEEFGIETPLHMNEFGPHGRFGRFDFCQREQLLRAAVNLINDYKIVSITTTVANQEFANAMDSSFNLSVYGTSFVGMVVRNQNNADFSGFLGSISYMFDEGNSKKHHVLNAHSVLRESPDLGVRLGPIAFDWDTYVGALQAADVVAWAERRRQGDPALRRFEPLLDLFSPDHHLGTPVTIETLQDINASLLKRRAERIATGLTDQDPEP